MLCAKRRFEAPFNIKVRMVRRSVLTFGFNLPILATNRADNSYGW
jgi:hypothetical protein